MAAQKNLEMTETDSRGDIVIIPEWHTVTLYS